MSAVVGQDWRPKTLKELHIQYQAIQLDRWHHTSHLKQVGLGKQVPYHTLHPYVEKPKGRVVKPWKSSMGATADGEEPI